jgi:hypothetical protein
VWSCCGIAGHWIPASVPLVLTLHPASQVQKGDRDEEVRKGTSSLQRREQLAAPPPLSACIVMNRLVARKHLGELKVCELAL